MGFRFRKSIKLAPGVKLNLTSRGLSSLSVGKNGARVNIGKKGLRGTVGIPGTGLSYSAYSPYQNQSSPRSGDGWQEVKPGSKPEEKPQLSEAEIKIFWLIFWGATLGLMFTFALLGWLNIFTSILIGVISFFFGASVLVVLEKIRKKS